MIDGRFEEMTTNMKNIERMMIETKFIYEKKNYFDVQSKRGWNSNWIALTPSWTYLTSM